MSNIHDLSLAGVPRTKNGLITPPDVAFYYLHREDGSAGGCVCFGGLKRWVDGTPRRMTVFARGVSFCSRLDRFSRATARELAYRRFLLAVMRAESTEPIHRTEMAHVIHWAVNPSPQTGKPTRSCDYKSGFDVRLSPGEQQLWALAQPLPTKPTAAERRPAAKKPQRRGAAKALRPTAVKRKKDS